MFLHNKKLMYTVRVDEPNPQFARLLLEQFGGANGELGAAMRYFTQAWNDPDPKRRGMLLDIATEELSHLEMVGQALVMLMKGSPAAEVDDVEGSYLGELVDGKHDKYVDLASSAPASVLSGGGPALMDSGGNRWTADWIDTLGEPTADLRSDIAAEARAKIVYERLIKLTDDNGLKDTLGFLMTREIAHQKMFEAALDALGDQGFPPGKLAGDERLAHTYLQVADGYGTDGSRAPGPGFEHAQAHTDWGFEVDTEPVNHAADQEVL